MLECCDRLAGDLKFHINLAWKLTLQHLHPSQGTEKGTKLTNQLNGNVS